MKIRRVSDAEYLARYDEEVKGDIEHHQWWAGRGRVRFDDIRDHPFDLKDDRLPRMTAWDDYAENYGELKAMNPDGTWRPWSPRELQP